MLLTVYSSDARIPLAGVLKYTKKLKDAVQTYRAMKPKSGAYPHTPAQSTDDYVLNRSFSCCVHPHVHTPPFSTRFTFISV